MGRLPALLAMMLSVVSFPLLLDLDTGLDTAIATSFRAVLAKEADAQVLQIPVGTPLLSVERLSRTYDDKPVELRRGLYLTEAHHYRNELS